MSMLWVFAAHTIPPPQARADDAQRRVERDEVTPMIPGGHLKRLHRADVLQTQLKASV